MRGAGGLLALGGVQQRAVLAMLALHLNKVVSTDFLIEGLWGARTPASAANTVQVYASRLRKVLQVADGPQRAAAAVLLRRGPGYVLDLDPEQIDLYRFRRLAREGGQALAAAPARAAGLLREALDCGAVSRWQSSLINRSRRSRRRELPRRVRRLQSLRRMESSQIEASGIHRSCGRWMNTPSVRHPANTPG